MAKLFNRAKMTTTTTGSGTITLGSASNGFQSFADAGVADGDVVQYVIEEGANFEIGTGTYSSSGTSLTRTPSESSNSDNAITLAGQATVSITAVADDLNRLQHNGSDKVTVSSTGASVTGNLAVSGTVDGVDVAARDSVLTSTTTTANAALPKAGGTMTGKLKIQAHTASSSSDFETKAEIGNLDISSHGYSGSSYTSFYPDNGNWGAYYSFGGGSSGGEVRDAIRLLANGNTPANSKIEIWNGTTFDKVFHDGYHPNADKWTTSRTLSLTGGVTGSVSWDGSANASLTSTVALATASAVGGIKIGYSENGKNYPVELDANGKAFVNVPWTDTNTDTNTTYSLKAQQTGGNDTNPNILLDASSGTDDTIQLVGAGATTVTRNSDGQITISSTDTDTTVTNFNSLTNKTGGTGEYSTSSHLTSGRGSGGVSLTINDGYGNANVTWNHKNGVPEQNGQSARIEVNTDSTTGEGNMHFEVSSAAVTSGTAVNLPVGMTLAHDYLSIPQKIQHAGDTDTFMEFHGGNSWRVVTGGTERLEATDSGVRIDDAFTLPTTDGSANQVLTTDGSGNVSWTTQIDTNTNTNQLTTFQVEDGDGTEVTISHGKEWKFVEGQGIDVNWTDTSTGSDGDPYDLTFSLKANGVRANELNVSGNGSSGQFLRSDGDGSFTWATPTDTNTTYSQATSSTLGLVKIGYSENGKNYPVELSSGQMFVNVPWTDTNTNTNQLTTFVVQDGDSTNVTISQGKYLKFAEGGAIDVNFTDTSTGSSGDPYDLTISHADTSSQGSVNNSNGTVIQDVTLDTYGHVTGLGSVDLDGRYYTESEINTFINRSYVSKHSASNLAAGWYTIAQNTGNRAVARFALWDTNSSDHQAVIFYAAHHYGTDASNTLTVLDNSYFSGNPFRYIRIKDAGTYDGAALQVYIDDATNAVNIAIVGDDVQSDGWDIVDFLADATAPSQVSNWSNFGERAKIDLNQIAQGGLATTGPIYADGDTTQYRVFNDNYHPNADKWTTARTLSLTGEVTGSVSWDGSANASISTTLTESPNFSTSLTVDGHTLQDSADRSGLLELSTSLGSWRGIQIKPTSTSLWSIMGDQDDFGLYDDYNSEWIMLYNENSTLQLYGNGSNQLSVGSTYVEVAGQIRHMGDTNTYMQFHAADQWRVVVGGTERLEVKNSSPHVLVTGDLNSTSDARLKENVEPIANALSDIAQLEGVSFDWKDTGTRGHGFIAQQVEPILPDVVNTDDETGIKSINYVGMIGHLVEAIKELKAEIEELKRQ